MSDEKIHYTRIEVGAGNDGPDGHTNVEVRIEITWRNGMTAGQVMQGVEIARHEVKKRVAEELL
ncbi:MAG TPA: hypothetical protein VK735_39735 [Pseudonocardia sp.]|uniref:hypothetical protein n=1 Tax=Pseudonocardia sp. TaxID=60912 RepID=UPI002CEBCC53|nr:hypothetical protein [Pseudonocardia sp.]HTF53615.1 hypothetical protein [Pseudonocardia sp.]